MINAKNISVDHSSICEGFLQTLLEVLRPKQAYPLHEPEFTSNELKYITETIESGWVSSAGKFVENFEKHLADYTGAKKAVAMVNGTAALQIGLLLAGVRPQDEVVVPAFSFVATANSVAHCGAIPNFVDISSHSLGIDVPRLRAYLNSNIEKTSYGAKNKYSGRRLGAIVPMHTFGHPMDIEELLTVASDFGVPVVEDAAESLGSFRNGQHTGTFGLCGAISFNGNKIITTGAGGALLFNDEHLAQRAKHITTTAKTPHRWRFFHDEVAWNYRMPNINAALGVAQLEILEGLVQKKRLLAKKYQEAFKSNKNFDWFDEANGNRSNFWLNAVMLREQDENLRDELLDYANNINVGVRPAWTLLNKLPMYSNCPSDDLTVSKTVEISLINLPSSPQIMNENTANA